LALNLCLLDLSNLLAALEHVARAEARERVVDLATSLERLVAQVNRPNVLARMVALRTAAAQRLGGWGHTRFVAEQSGVERLFEQGDYATAVQAARQLLQKAEQTEEVAYREDAYDLAIAQQQRGYS
jgi:hypothetical protein